jgi:hypothetical protein
MALEQRKNAFSRADLPTEPAGPDAGESIRSQLLLQQRLMTKEVVVTLDEPYLGDPEATIALVFGRDEAQPIGSDYYRDEGAGSPPVLASDRLLTQSLEYAAPRWEPGNWIHYHLRFNPGPLGKCSCNMDPETFVEPTSIMPAPVARLWFGDWDVVSYELRARPGQQLDDWLKRTWHRDRVANEMWGGYEWDFPPGVPVNYRAMRRFGPPAVPHVTIHRLDTAKRRIPNSAAKPWDIFDWIGVCEKGPRVYHKGAPTHDATPGMLTLTEADLSARIAAGIAAALSAHNAPAPRKGTTS